MLHCENALQCLSHCQIVLCNIERIKSVVGYLRRDNLTNDLLVIGNPSIPSLHLAREFNRFVCMSMRTVHYNSLYRQTSI